MSLGKCRVCGNGASAVYPLLPGSPAFCSEHHNPKDASPFGCDFNGPVDFDIPWGDDDRWYGLESKPQKLDRDAFIWRDRKGDAHLLVDINDVYLQNIINFLRRGGGHVAYNSVERRRKVIEFLEKEMGTRRLTIE